MKQSDLDKLRKLQTKADMPQLEFDPCDSGE